MVSSESITLTLEHVIFFLQTFYNALHFSDINVDLHNSFIFGLKFNDFVAEVTLQLTYGLFETHDLILLFYVMLLQAVVLLVGHLKSVVFSFEELHFFRLGFPRLALGCHFREI